MFKNIWIAAVLMLSAGFAITANAEVRHADAYESLTAVQLQPGQAPRTINGVAELSGTEKHHGERLPLQLEGAIRKVKKAKYAPSVARDTPVDF